MKPTPMAVALLALCACSGITRDDDRRVSGTIVLSSNEVAALAQPGPFISVADRIDIRATNTDGEIVAQTGFQLQRYDSTASATLEVPEGSTTFTVEVSSASGIVLYSGSATAIVADGFEIDVPLIAVRPVLVIQPDTVRTTGGVARFIVYNGGTQTLNWSINNPGTCTLGGVCPFPTSGALAAGQSTTFSATLPGNTPSGNYSLVVSSPEGSVSPVWAYTRPNVIGFSVWGDSSRVFVHSFVGRLRP